MKRRLRSRLIACAAIAFVTLTARGDDTALLATWPQREFEFVRMIYTELFDSFGGRGRVGSWTVDMPEAEYFFSKGVSRLTRIDMGGEGIQLDLTDDALFDYPWIYAVEVGHWQLSEIEAERLREYLLRGGFLMVDDFHGSEEWFYFEESMNRVFPDRPVLDIRDESEILHVVYDVDERIQVPGIGSVNNGRTYERDGVEPTWRGIYDDRGRLMVIINHNMDLGDAWEHADTPRYPQEMTTLALHFAVNYVIYAMTH
jgi:hypothetical protein